MVVSVELGSGGAAQARSAVRAALAGRRDDGVETAVLLTSELVANALLHGGSAATLVIRTDGERLRVEVIDTGSDGALVPLDVDSDAEHGRGLKIVDALATAWGVDPRHPGKAVWFELALPPSDHGRSAIPT